jgi:hypothetical protein
MAYARITLLQLKDRLAERVGGQNKFWTEPEREAAINEALAVWQLMTGDFVDTADATVTYGTEAVYTVDLGAGQPIAFLRLKMAQTEGDDPFWPEVSETPINQISLRELDQGFYEWRSESTLSIPEYWVPVCNDKIAVHPKPTEGSNQHGEQNFNMMYLRGDRPLTADADFVQLGDEEVVRILDYAQAVLAFKQGSTEAFEMSDPLRQMFGQAASRRGSWLRNSSIYRKFMGQEDDQSPTLRQAAPQTGVRS